jgi:hypothetical protein
MYYWDFRDHVGVSGVSALAPILMGFVLYPLFEPLMTGYTPTAVLHLGAFAISAVAASYLFDELELVPKQ